MAYTNEPKNTADYEETPKSFWDILLQENSDLLLQENGDYILLESSSHPAYTNSSKNTAIYTNETKH